MGDAPTVSASLSKAVAVEHPLETPRAAGIAGLVF